MKGRYKKRDLRDRCEVPDELCSFPGDPAAGFAEPNVPTPVFTSQEGSGSKRGARRSEKVYLGVRVKMPVRDLLRNKRLAQGWEPQDVQETNRKRVKGEKKRVNTRTGYQTTKKKHPTKSLEELAIIVEVLEEDLRAGSTSYSPLSVLSSDPEQSPAGYNSDESDEMIPSPQAYMTYSLATGDCPPNPPPPGFMYTNCEPSFAAAMRGDEGGVEEWLEPQTPSCNLNSSAYFWTQLQKEESLLVDISDAALLTRDEHGRTALHKVACVGKRALGYAVAKRMAALNSLDLKDADGMTALLHAANHNHHLMVADLISLGANVNEANNSGKSCLHLSAEKGYIRVLEVLKHAMTSGLYVDVEATDNCGMSVLQCTSVALKDAVCELESSRSPSQTRLYTLRQEQMLETLECLLHMGSYLHTMRSWSKQPRLG